MLLEVRPALGVGSEVPGKAESRFHRDTVTAAFDHDEQEAIINCCLTLFDPVLPEALEDDAV